MLSKIKDAFAQIRYQWTDYILAVAIGLFAILRLTHSFPRFSDGNIYLYLSYLISQGATPYKDFFYSSPPLILYLYTLFGTIFGFSWQAFNFIPLILTAIDAVLIYFIIQHRYSIVAGLLSSILYLSSYTVLATTDFVSDVHIILTLVLAGIFAAEKNRPRWSGFFFALASLAKLYALVLTIAWLLHYIWHKRWLQLVNFSLIFCLVFFGSILISWLLYGQIFITYMIDSHRGAIEGIAKLKIFNFFFTHDWILVAAPLFWLYVRRRVPSVIITPILCLLAFYLLFQDIYFLYFKILAAFLALWWGWNYFHIRNFISYHNRISIFLFLTVAVPILSIGRYFSEQSQAAVMPLYPVVEYVEAHTNRGEKIYGSFEIAPLVSLESDRPLWHNLADTNSKFFMTGLFDYEERAKKVAADNVHLIITKALIVQGERISTGPEQVLPRSFFTQNCEIGQKFPLEHDYFHNAVIVWLCHY